MTQTNSASRALAIDIDNRFRESISDEPDGDESKLIAAQEQLAEQFKSLRSRGAPKPLIMEALGLTEDDYSKLSAREDVKSAVIKAELERTSASATFDSNWDKIEDMALKAVARELASSPEPEFALKVAAVANKAVRRRREDARLAQQQASAITNIGNANIAILSLPKVFMNELVNQTSQQAQRQIEIQRSAVETKKLESMADIGTIRNVLGYSLDSANSIKAEVLDSRELTGPRPQSREGFGEVTGHLVAQGIAKDSVATGVPILTSHSVDDLFADLADEEDSTND